DLDGFSAALCFVFFLDAPATPGIYTLSLHDALPISHLVDQDAHVEVDRHPGDGLELVERAAGVAESAAGKLGHRDAAGGDQRREDRKSTRLNSSHVKISYAVFCLKKKKQKCTASIPT